MTLSQKLIKTKKFLLSLPRNVKICIALSADICFCTFSVFFSYYLRLGTFTDFYDVALTSLLVSILLVLPTFTIFGLYQEIFRYNGWRGFSIIARAMALYGFLYSFVFTVIGISGVPRTIGLIQPILLFLFICLSRVIVRVYLGQENENFLKKDSPSKILIYGAGPVGQQLAQAVSINSEMQMCGFLDDDQTLHEQRLNGHLVFNPTYLEKIIESKSIDCIIFAMPNIKRKQKIIILNRIQKAQVLVRVLPSVTEIADGKVSISDLEELDLDDLLGREKVEPDLNLMAMNIAGKIIMVTGAGGSIGSELCRQIVDQNPKKLLMVEQSEFSLYEIHQELENKKKETVLVPLLASAQDADRMNKIISTWNPHTIYHAAAYKHVPLVEHNLSEGVKNNVVGTLAVAQAAIAHRVKNFVLISTDKAVRPTNIMGASKRLAEMVLQALAAENNTVIFSMVRFGNVLGSSGSVVPKFRQQIKDGGPVTITHPEITRFFMTIPEASQLVIQAGAMARGGEVFVLDMGKPIKILDLAERMIELSGVSVKNEQNPDGDIEINFTKLRPGEKLYEELLIGKNSEPTSHPRIMKAHESFLKWDKLEEQIKTLIEALNANDALRVYHILEKLVTDYHPNSNLVDWVYLEHGKER